MALDVSGIAILLWVYDMPTSIRFYRDTLGFELVSTSDVLGEDYFHWAMLRIGKAQLMLNTIFESNEARPSPPPRSESQPQRDAWLYCDCPDADAAYEELDSKGVEVQEPTVTYYGMKQVSLFDPDGYRICFQCLAKS